MSEKKPTPKPNPNPKQPAGKDVIKHSAMPQPTHIPPPPPQKPKKK